LLQGKAGGDQGSRMKMRLPFSLQDGKNLTL